MKSLGKRLLFFHLLLIISGSFSKLIAAIEVEVTSLEKSEIEFGQSFDVQFTVEKKMISELSSILEINSKIEKSFFIKSLSCKEMTLELNRCNLTLIYLKHPEKQQLVISKEDKSIYLKVGDEIFSYLKPGAPPEGLKPFFAIKKGASFGLTNWLKFFLFIVFIGLVYLIRRLILKRNENNRKKEIKELLKSEIRLALTSRSRAQIEMLQKNSVKWSDCFSNSFGKNFIEELNKHQFKKDWSELEFELLEHQLKKMVESIERGI